MYDFERGYEEEHYISDTNTKEQRIRQLCEEYPLFKRKPKGRKITNYYVYYGIPKPPANRSDNLKRYYLDILFSKTRPLFILLCGRFL